MLDGVINKYDSYEEIVAQQSSLPLIDRVDGSDMLYSSGTTGRPKGVALNLGKNPLGSPNGVTSLGQFLFAMDDSTIYLSPAPLYHAAPLRWNLAVHRVGGTTIIMENFDAEEYLQLIEKHNVTHSQTVLTMFVRLLKLPNDVRTRYKTTSLTHIFHAAAPCPIDIKQQTIEWLGPIVHEYYAGSEGNGFVYCNSEQWLAHPGTVGQSLQGVIHILDDDGNELEIGQTGTIYFETQATFEYHNDPEKTKASKDSLGRGWSTLGDIGYLDNEQFLYLTDRKAFMIIAGGVNIYPQEAENVLVSHPDVIDVAVFGIPNEEFGEEVKAVVQPTVMPVSPEDAKKLERVLIEHCKTSLASFKCPKSVDFRTELPRHPTGKLYKRLLKDEYWAAAGRSI
jgi:acyl-CoA synthetase (AMP-forming)/AMP-acid ligase II